MKKLLLLSCLFISLSIQAQTIDDVFPFVKLSTTKDTLFVLNNTVGNCIGEVWEKNPIEGTTQILAYTDDIDYFLDKRKNCTKIVKSIRLN